MKKYNIPVAALFCFYWLFAISCMKSDWFDVKSDKSLTVPSTLLDFEYLLDNFVVMNQESAGLAEVGSDDHYVPENAWSAISQPTERNAYTWTNTLPYLIVGDWNQAYARIFVCNLVLHGLEKINPVGLEEREMFNRIKGNALFHRSKNYYDLAQIYAQPYKAESAALDLGIPLKDGIDITELAKRSSVQQTYNKITTDLLLAAGLLPSSAQLPTRGSKINTFALLARTFLSMGQYDKAGAYADSSLKLYDKLIDFNTVASTNTNLGRFNLETIFYAQRTTNWASTWTPQIVFVERTLFDSYDNNDLRKTRFFSVANGNVTFKGNYNNGSSGFDGLATDEQYMIKAECLARSGSFNEAMKVLNNFLRTRWNNQVVYSDITANNADDALRKILVERRKELLFRNIRWSDLRRLNQDSRFRITIRRTIGGSTYILEPDSYRYTLPLPDDVISFSNIEQAPGWSK